MSDTARLPTAGAARHRSAVEELLRTIESMYGPGHLKLAKQANTIADVWQ